MNENQIMKKKFEVLKEMEKVLKIMDYIKVIDTALSKSTDLKFKNYWTPKFKSNVYILRNECIHTRTVLEEWFKFEQDNNLEIDINLRASYKAMEGFQGLKTLTGRSLR